MTKISKSDFGITKSNEQIYLFTIKDEGFEVVLSNYGANIIFLKVPDRNGIMTDVSFRV